MEFKMETALDTALPKTIAFNKAELKAELEEKLQKYNALLVTEDSIPEAKKDLANLRKFKEALEDKRKEVKAACLEPYNAFERDMKELVGLVDSPIAAINGQIKSFDDTRKAEKTAQIEEIYTEEIKDLADLIPLQKLWNSRWLNVGYPLQDIRKEIGELAFKASNDLRLIAKMYPELGDRLQKVYLDTLDMSETLAEKDKIEAQAAALKNIVQKETVKEAPASNSESQEQMLETLDFRVFVTAQQKSDLRSFLINNHIKFCRVPKGE